MHACNLLFQNYIYNFCGLVTSNNARLLLQLSTASDCSCKNTPSQRVPVTLQFSSSELQCIYELSPTLCRVKCLFKNSLLILRKTTKPEKIKKCHLVQISKHFIPFHSTWHLNLHHGLWWLLTRDWRGSHLAPGTLSSSSVSNQLSSCAKY